MYPKNFFLFFIAFTLVCMRTQTILAQPWYKENFDKLDKGELTGQDGWLGEVADKSGEIDDDVVRGGKGKSLYIVENSGNQREFAEVHEGVQYFSLYAYRENEGGGDLQIYTGSSSDWAGAINVAIFSRIDGDGTLHLADGNGDGSVKEELATLPYPIKEWFHVRLVMDFDDQTYAGYLNGKLAAEDVGFRGAPIGLGWINIRWDHDAKLSIYIDDIEVGDGEGGEEAIAPDAQMTSVVWGRIKKHYM